MNDKKHNYLTDIVLFIGKQNKTALESSSAVLLVSPLRFMPAGMVERNRWTIITFIHYEKNPFNVFLHIGSLPPKCNAKVAILFHTTKQIANFFLFLCVFLFN